MVSILQLAPKSILVVALVVTIVGLTYWILVKRSK